MRIRNACIALVLLSGAMNANALTFTQSQMTTDTGSQAHFNVATYMFGQSVMADTLTMSNFGSGIAHSHSNGTPVNIFLNVFRVATNQWESAAPVQSVSTVAGTQLSTLFAAPSTFALGLISGVQLQSFAHQNQTFHNVSGGLTFETSAVPEMDAAALPLGIGLVLSLIGLFRERDDLAAMA